MEFCFIKTLLKHCGLQSCLLYNWFGHSIPSLEPGKVLCSGPELHRGTEACFAEINHLPIVTCEWLLLAEPLGHVEVTSGPGWVLNWLTLVSLSCSFPWGPSLQPLLCQCISARGSVCQHYGDPGALPRCWYPSCVSPMVPSDRRGDLRCPRDPPRPPQRHSPDLPLPSFKL